MASTTTAPVRARGFSRKTATLADEQERLRELLADKSTLARVRLLPRDQWIKKDERPHCVFCVRKFRTFSRKLHCRACGDVVCSACYRKRDVQIGPAMSDTLPVRLCFDCIDRALAPPSPSPDMLEDDDDSFEGSFTNSGRVTLSACSSHMKFVDGLLVDESARVAAATASAATDSFVNLELSHYDEEESDAGEDTDRESLYSYDSDGDRDESFHSLSPPTTATSDRSKRTFSAKSLSLSSSSTSTVSSSTSTSSTTSSSSSSSSHRMLGFVPEDESLGDFVSDMKLTLSDLDVDTAARRSELLKQYNVASLRSQREFDALCELVSRAFDCGVAAVGFLGESAQWYKAKIGISQSQLPREVAFCAQVFDEATAPSTAPIVVLDATRDARFRSNPLVTGSAHIRFYASAPICDPESQIVLGSVFVMDPHSKTQLPARALEVLAYAAAAAQQLVVGDQTSRNGRRTRQERIRRVFSESVLGGGIVTGERDSRNEQDDVRARDAERLTQSDGPRGGSGALWTTEPPQPVASRSQSFRPSSSTGSNVGIKLLDSEALATSLKAASRRSSACETESAKVLGRSAPPPKASKATATPTPTAPSPALCEEIRQQLETTQQLLLSFGSARSRRSSRMTTANATGAEVEV